MQPRIGIIGTGKVGCTLARLWKQAGYEITAVYNRTPEKAEMLVRYIPSAQVVKSPTLVVEMADIILLTVSDDVLPQIASKLSDFDCRGKIIVHTSGVASIDVLQGLLDVEAMVGSLHPIFPFADVETAIRDLQGSTFAIEASDEHVQQRLTELVESLKGQILLIPSGKKALYHAALAIASNYTVTLYAVAEAILVSIGAEKSVADNALNVLIEATVRNIRQQGIPQALTGALTRADVGTIQSHLKAIDDELLRNVYTGLARLSYPMLQERGVDTTQIEQVIQENT
jgi:predicted short-subunit dehydrogenase-like oxidoreductase (DUF2520 family)